jgi:hypothetical protein
MIDRKRPFFSVDVGREFVAENLSKEGPPMQFFSRIFGSDAKVSRVRPGDRYPCRRRAQFTLETLEERDLKSSIVPGVDLSDGVLTITATQYSGNSANVSIDPSNQNLKVTLNGNSVEYNPGEVYWGQVNYKGGLGGYDTFTNDTSYSNIVTVFTGNNTVRGGTGFNSVTLWGDHNAYDSGGGDSYIFTINGYHDSIADHSNQSVNGYTMPDEWLQYFQG